MRLGRTRSIITDGVGVQRESRLSSALKFRYVGTGMIGTGFAYGLLRGATRMPAPTFVGNLPSLSHDYAGNIDRIMLRGRGMPGSAEEIGATGDLVLAMGKNRGRQF